MRSLSILALAAALAGCGAEAPQPPAPTQGAKQIARDVLAKAKSDAGAYPLDTCVVSGEKLGAMGDPVIFQWEGQEVRLCCSRCKPEFEKDPAKYLAKIKK